MDYVESDLKQIFKSIETGTQITEGHIKTILYNSLCALNFVHSAGVMHRDIKPSNFLVDRICSVKICDFGLARTVPSYQNQQGTVFDLNRKLRKEVLDFRSSDLEAKKLKKKKYKNQFYHIAKIFAKKEYSGQD